MSEFISDYVIYELGIETTKLLIQKQDDLKKINWTNGEANIDTEYSTLSCQCCTVAWDTLKQNDPTYQGINITCTIPDINILMTYPDGRTSKHKIELKSSKHKKMPGSTIKQLDINQTMIYCLRPSTNSELYKLKCSQYHSSMGESDTDLFQDRTPRPFINFEKMTEIDDTLPFIQKEKTSWIEHYANCGLNRINENTACAVSWQDDLIKIMKKKIIEDYIKNTSQEQFQIDKLSLQMAEL